MIKVAAAYVIVGWLILQVGEVLAPALRLPDWVNSMLAFFIILGFPLAMFFAWAFEMTPEGLKKERDVDRSQSITQVTGQKLNYTIIALLVLALAYFAWDEFVVERREASELAVQTVTEVPAGKRRQSIAVLPLADMSPQGDSEYFSDGLTEELLNILAKISELQVAGRTSSFAFKGKNEDLRAIGEKLGVDHILEGSVRKDDARNRVRITLQLINTDDGYHLWSETYDRDLDDIFAIQEEVAGEVANALRVTLLGEDGQRIEQVATTDISAYELYLQGMQGIHEGGFDSLEVAEARLQEALALDPAYLPARLALVNAWSQKANTGAMTRQEALTRGLPILESILAEEPGNSDAHVQMALFNAYAGDVEAAERSFTRALEMSPRNASALQEYGRFLFNQNEMSRGLELIAAAVEIEPYAIRVLWDQCQSNAQAQNTEIALVACGRIREIRPESPLGYYGYALAHLYAGDLARGAEGYFDAIQRDPGDFEMLAAMTLFWVDLGDVHQAKQWLQRANAIGAGQPVPNNSQLAIYLVQEQHDLAGQHALQSRAVNPENRHGTNYFFMQAIAYSALLAGDYDAGLEPYRESYPWAFADDFTAPDQAGYVVDDLLVAAAMLKQADPLSERPAQLLDLAEREADDFYPGWGIHQGELRRARVAALRGNNEEAIEYLEKARDMGWRLFWRRSLLHDPTIHGLKNEPGYQNLVAFFEADMERQRQLAYELLEIQP